MVQSLHREDTLEKGMATHSSFLAWRIPCTEKPGGLQFMGSQRAGHNWATNNALEGRFLTTGPPEKSPHSSAPSPIPATFLVFKPQCVDSFPEPLPFHSFVFLFLLLCSFCLFLPLCFCGGVNLILSSFFPLFKILCLCSISQDSSRVDL